ncbi:MAG: glycosyltransferase family 4 protein [bacterium]|nr:glycosyltransferase family 4 protein [bacterium]
MRDIKKKLVYILPEYRSDIDTHFYHKVEFLRRIKDEVDLQVIIERGEKPEGLEAHTYVQKINWAPLRVLEFIFVLMRLRLRGYNIFWTHYSYVGALVAPFFGKSLYWNCGMPWLYKRPLLREWAFRRALLGSILVTGTERMKNLYIEHYKLDSARVRVVPNWINIKRFASWYGKKEKARDELGLDQNKKIVLFLHHLSKRKGADKIEPTAKLLEENKDIEVVVVGTGPMDGRIKGPNITLIGSVAQNEVPRYLAAADIFFMPSEEEGFPNVLLEAMVLGIPIVASDIGGVREIVSPWLRDYVSLQDPAIFAKNIKKLIKEPALIKTISEEERRWVTNYEIDSVLHAFMSAL